MHLLVGIDTEGDNQWDAAARANQRFENIYALPRLHALFARHGVRPTYVITYPVATDARSADVLRALLAGGDCEIGAHHHAWETPPCTAEDVRRHPYAASLPRAQFEAQLTELTDAVERAVGQRPVSYRSGRFGFSAAHVSALERLGYLVESSVAPLFYEAHKQGPDFVEAPLRPYFLAYDSATRPGTSNLLEVPCSAALNRRVPRRLQYLYARAPKPYTTKRVLRKLGLAYVRWLRPSYSSLDDMIALATDLAHDGEPVLNLLFHSSEAIVGGSPYNRTEAELAAFCDRLERFFEFARTRLNAVPATFAEFRAAYAPSTQITPSTSSTSSTADLGPRPSDLDPQ
jgi:peptidoglycan/xylan/chitin deacetylase (PgdA/CDA1 family)